MWYSHYTGVLNFTIHRILLTSVIMCYFHGTGWRTMFRDYVSSIYIWQSIVVAVWFMYSHILLHSVVYCMVIAGFSPWRDFGVWFGWSFCPHRFIIPLFSNTLMFSVQAMLRFGREMIGRAWHVITCCMSILAVGLKLTIHTHSSDDSSSFFCCLL